jgi:hypothetical protein
MVFAIACSVCFVRTKQFVYEYIFGPGVHDARRSSNDFTVALALSWFGSVVVAARSYGVLAGYENKSRRRTKQVVMKEIERTERTLRSQNSDIKNEQFLGVFDRMRDVEAMIRDAAIRQEIHVAMDCLRQINIDMDEISELQEDNTGSDWLELKIQMACIRYEEVEF